MKTLPTTTRNVIINHGRIRLFLAIAGVVIAVLCTIAFLQDVHSAEASNLNSPRLMDAPMIGVVDFMSEAMTSL